jgi:hypothetical protein
MLYATRHTTANPNVAVIRRFEGPLTREELDAEARRLAANPYGLGRRLLMPRIPGAQPEWCANSTPPMVRIPPPAPTAERFAAAFAHQLSICANPADGAGWHMAALGAPDGSTVVVVVMSHLYGGLRDIIAEVWGDGDQPRADRSEAAPWPQQRPRAVRDDIADLRRRVLWAGRGLRANTNAGPPPKRPASAGPVPSGAPLKAVLRPDATRGRPSRRRVAATASIDGASWDDAARAHEGSRFALKLAVTANLLREAATARGADPRRPVQIAIPMDLSDPANRENPAAILRKPGQMITGEIALRWPAVEHGNLAQLRAASHEVIAHARAMHAARPASLEEPNPLHTMRLLPDRLTMGVALRIAAAYDGAMTSVGDLPRGLMKLGGHRATEAFVAGFPMGPDLTVASADHDERLALCVVADEERLGEGPPLRERVARELAQWGIDVDVA